MVGGVARRSARASLPVVLGAARSRLSVIAMTDRNRDRRRTTSRRKGLLLAAATALAVGAVGSQPAGAAFPGANGKIAFTRGSVPEIYVMNPDGTGQTQLTSNSVPDRGPAWSADGTRIAFFRDVGDFNREIYVMNADGSGETRLTANAARDEDPAWSPDGSKIAFWSDRDGDEEVFVMSADGSNQRRIDTGAGDAESAAWSPDGRHLAYQSNRSGAWQIYTMHVDGSDQRPLAVLDATSPSWSPRLP